MNIIVCYKISPDAEDIQVKPDGSISLDAAEWTIGQYDRPAIEAGVQLAKASGGKTLALSAGPSEINTSKAKKDVLSRGPDELFWVADDRLEDADSYFTAQTLAAAVQKIGGYDLVICGEGSADMYAQQVGIQLGEILGIPTINAVSRIDVDDSSILVERNLEEEIEILRLPLPAVISVTSDIAEPRVASMKMILAAGKKPVTIWSLVEVLASGAAANTRQVISTLGPEKVERKGIVLEGSVDETSQQLVSILSKEGVI